MKQALQKHGWKFVVGVTAIIFGSITDRVGFGAAGFGLIFAFIHGTITELRS